MKRLHTFQFAPSDFVWVDLIDPTEKELKSLAKQYNLDKKSVLACLDPEHLPKFEKLQNYHFLILRHFDENAAPVADTVQELTRKVAIFLGHNFLLTIHRRDSSFFQDARRKWSEPTKDSEGLAQEWPSDIQGHIFSDILIDAIQTYEVPLSQGADELEQIEMGIFEAAGAIPFEMEKGYFLKRKASVFKRIIRSTMEMTQKFHTTAPQFFRLEVKENLEKLYFYADELNDNVAGLLNLYLSISAHKTNVASHRTNEVVRILTVVSLFFLPLNFIAGIYGMNFEHMPELKWEHGYYGVLILMIMVVLGLYTWFRRRGWLKPEPPQEKVSALAGASRQSRPQPAPQP